MGGVPSRLELNASLTKLAAGESDGRREAARMVVEGFHSLRRDWALAAEDERAAAELARVEEALRRSSDRA